MKGKLKLLFGLMIVFNIIIVTMVISIYFHPNPIGRHITKVKVLDGVSLFPQGWGFFTRNSKGPRTYTAEYIDESLRDINFRNFSAENYFGISRNNRLRAIQVKNILGLVPGLDSLAFDRKAVDIQEIYTNLNLATLNFQRVCIEPHLAPDFQGKYVIVNQRMLPWSMIQRKRDYPSQFKVVPVEVIHRATIQP